MKRFLYPALMMLVSCEVRSIDDKKAPAPLQETTLPPTPTPIVVTPSEPVKPKTTPGIPQGELGEAMGYSLPNASGLYVIDIKRLVASSMLGAALTQINTLLGATPSWQEVLSTSGLDPMRDLRGVVVSIREPTGGSNEIVLTLVGAFDSVVVAKALHDSATRGDNDAVAVGKGLVIVGKPTLLAEAKLASERGVLVDAPVLLAALSGVDVARPAFGVYLPSAVSRASAHGSERAKQVTAEFDASTDLYLKVNFQFDTPKEAEDAKVELDDGLKQLGPVAGMFGVTDSAKLLKAFTTKTDGAQFMFLLALDGATAKTIIEGILRFSAGSAGVAPTSPAPTPSMPPMTPEY